MADWGHHAPAPIFGWSVLEALAHLAGGSGPARGLSPIQAVQAVQALAAEGYIENEDAQRLRGMARLRSAVVHGDFSRVVTAGQVRFLIEQLEAMKSNIMAVAAEESAERVQRAN